MPRAPRQDADQAAVVVLGQEGVVAERVVMLAEASGLPHPALLQEGGDAPPVCRAAART